MEKDNSKFIRMTTEPVQRLICTLAIPTIISMMVTALYNIADTFFVGRIGTEATAGVGLVFPIMTIIQAFGFFFGQGSGNYISRSLGAQKLDHAAYMAATGSICALLFGGLILGLGQAFRGTVLQLIGARADLVSAGTVEAAKAYLSFILCGAPFMCASCVLNNQMRFQGNAFFSMIGLVSGAVINVALDPILIFGAKMGVAGAALATSVSQAISCAFDSAQWCALNRGRHLPSTGPLPPGVDGRLETPHPYAFDPDKARALLAEAGYPGGVDPATGRRLALSLDLGKSDQETREGAELLASFLDRIGIALELRFSTFPQFMRRLNRREEQMFLVGWVADWPDALNFLQLFYSKNQSPGPNRVNYANPAYDALYEEAASTTDPARRLELVRAMQDAVREDCPWACLYYRREFVLVGPDILGFRLHDFPLGAEKHWRRR